MVSGSDLPNLSSYISYVVSSSSLENYIALKATPPQVMTLQLVAAPTCTWKLDMNFDDVAFAHMLKDYSVFSFVPRLSYTIRNWFISMLLYMEMNIHMY